MTVRKSATEAARFGFDSRPLERNPVRRYNEGHVAPHGRRNFPLAGSLSVGVRGEPAVNSLTANSRLNNRRTIGDGIVAPPCGAFGGDGLGQSSSPVLRGQRGRRWL